MNDNEMFLEVNQELEARSGSEHCPESFKELARRMIKRGHPEREIEYLKVLLAQKLMVLPTFKEGEAYKNE